MAKSNNKALKKRMDKNCHIPDLVQAFSNLENVEEHFVVTEPYPLSIKRTIGPLPWMTADLLFKVSFDKTVQYFD